MPDLNQLIEIIKIIKKTENISLVDCNYEDLNENQKFIQCHFIKIYLLRMD